MICHLLFCYELAIGRPLEQTRRAVDDVIDIVQLTIALLLGELGSLFPTATADTIVQHRLSQQVDRLVQYGADKL